MQMPSVMTSENGEREGDVIRNPSYGKLGAWDDILYALIQA